MSIPAIYGRVPNLLTSQTQLRNITDTNVEVFGLNQQIATGKRINRPSDDPVAASVISVIDQRLETSEQRQRNLSHGSAVLNSLDATLAQIRDLTAEARTLALDQVGVGSDAGTRASTAEIVNQQITQLLAAVNRDYAGVNYLSGSKTGQPAFQAFNGGYVYTGDDSGLFTDLGPEVNFPITLGAGVAVGATSARQQGTVDLNPTLTPITRVEDLRGPMTGKQLGTLEINLSSVPDPILVDLSNAETISDVEDLIEAAIRDADPTAFGAALPGDGVTLTPDRLQINLAGAVTATFDDGAVGATASALGLAGITYTAGTTTNAAPNASLDPQLADYVTLGSLASAPTFGDIRFTNGGRAGTITTNAAMTVGELKEQLDRLDLGLEIEIDGAGNAINIVNNVSGVTMSVSDNGVAAASSLGIRTMQADTPLSQFNFGRGVEIATGNTDPVTGLPDQDRNDDFRVTLSDGSSFVVDLVEADLASVQTLINKINAEWAASGIGGGFNAQLSTTQNGIVFTDTAGGPDAISVQTLNGYAAEDLGLTQPASTAAGQLISGDRSQVRVNSMFTTLMELRDALLADDTRTLNLTGPLLDEDVDRVINAQALVGTRARRVDDLAVRQQELDLVDQRIRSDLADVDFAEAATNLNLLTTQLQAGMQVAAQTSQLSLLNFLR